MSGNPAPVSVRILEKEYQIACPEDERSDLLRCAEMLNTRMKEIRDSGKVIGLERIAVMAALNLSYELIRESNADDRLDDRLFARVHGLRAQVESALEAGQQLEL